MSNITIEQRNAQKLNNLLNIANLNIKNKDIYFFLKCNVKVLLNKLQLAPKDLEILSGHVSAFSNELTSSKWDLRKFDPKKYQKFLDDLFNKIDFRKVDTEFMFKCKDLLEISPVKNDLYRRRMEFFDKKLPKISQFNNNLNKTHQQNYNFNNNYNNNTTSAASQQPVNPFAGINNESPYGNYYNNNSNNSPYNNLGKYSNQGNRNNNINNNNEKGILTGQKIPASSNMNNNNVNNMNNNKMNVTNNINNNMNNNMNNNTNNNMNKNLNYNMNYNMNNNLNNNMNNNNMNTNMNNNMNNNNMNYNMNNNNMNYNMNNNNMNNNMNYNMNNNNMNYNMNNNPYNMENKKKKIPENIKEKIIKELQIVSQEIVNGKIDNCRKHSVEAFLLFKQIFPDQ